MTETLKGKKILIVDDDDEIRNYIAIELQNHYNIIKKENGKLALPEVIKNAPALIISDVVMPEMDGITLTRKIKKNIHHRDAEDAEIKKRVTAKAQGTQRQDLQIQTIHPSITNAWAPCKR